ncbi:hypothetical protein LCGC14_0605900 [marine sediment metagenome]|uniref:Uncharacterized protein n=1 Tax=marine sediment metagenome TaxID=412755 RepID=A0A0F9UHK1_9ZZZZ
MTYEQFQLGQLTTVRVTSPLVGDVYHYWFIDGTFVAMTASPEYVLILPEGDQARVECIASNDASFDYVLNGPATPSIRSVVWWIASTAADVALYKIEQAKDGGVWTEIGRMNHDADRWDYRLVTPRLDDLSSYAWRVVPVDKAGNDGQVVSQAARTIVRTPDGPDFTVAFDEGTTRVTFTEAA